MQNAFKNPSGKKRGRKAKEKAKSNEASRSKPSTEHSISRPQQSIVDDDDGDLLGPDYVEPAIVIPASNLADGSSVPAAVLLPSQEAEELAKDEIGVDRRHHRSATKQGTSKKPRVPDDDDDDDDDLLGPSTNQSEKDDLLLNADVMSTEFQAIPALSKSGEPARRKGELAKAAAEEEEEEEDALLDDSAEAAEEKQESRAAAQAPPISDGTRVQIIDGKVVLFHPGAAFDPGANGPPLQYAKESDKPVTYNTFARKKGSKEIWDQESTKRFYKALRQYGTDFSFIEKQFPSRSRAQIKNKFKKEEKLNPKKIEYALKNRLPIDEKKFREMLSQTEEYKRAKEKQLILAEKEKLRKKFEEAEEMLKNQEKSQDEEDWQVVASSNEPAANDAGDNADGNENTNDDFDADEDENDDLLGAKSRPRNDEDESGNFDDGDDFF